MTRFQSYSCSSNVIKLQAETSIGEDISVLCFLEAKSLHGNWHEQCVVKMHLLLEGTFQYSLYPYWILNRRDMSTDEQTVLHVQVINPIEFHEGVKDSLWIFTNIYSNAHWKTMLSHSKKDLGSGAFTRWLKWASLVLLVEYILYINCHEWLLHALKK